MSSFGSPLSARWLQRARPGNNPARRIRTSSPGVAGSEEVANTAFSTEFRSTSVARSRHASKVYAKSGEEMISRVSSSRTLNGSFSEVRGGSWEVEREA
jgi:hypothetical protein